MSAAPTTAAATAIPPPGGLTPAQERALHGIDIGSFILAERPFAAPHLLLVDSITATSQGVFQLGTKAQYEITAPNIFDYQRHGTWNLAYTSWDWPQGSPLSELLHPSDILTLNPSVDILIATYFSGVCLYPNCTRGLVRKSPMTVNDVHFLETESRSGREVWTLCPFCMGGELQRRHEWLVTCSQPERYGVACKQDHLQIINAKRSERGYNPLPQSIDMVVLDLHQQTTTSVVGSQSSRPSTPSHDPTLDLSPPRRFRVPNPIHSRHSSRHRSHWPEGQGPRLSSHTFKWFQTAHERIMLDVCGLCQQDYQEGEQIVDLACQHFYHERCLGTLFEFQRRGRKWEECPLCRRKVVG